MATRTYSIESTEGAGYLAPWRRRCGNDDGNGSLDDCQAWAAETAAPIRQVVVRLSQELAASAPGNIDDVLSDGLRSLAEALQMDWAVLWRMPVEGAGPIASHHWIRLPAALDPQSPWSSSLVAPVLEEQAERWIIREQGLRSGVILPVSVTGPAASYAALGLGSATMDLPRTGALQEPLLVAAAAAGQALARRDAHAALMQALDDVRQLRERSPFARRPDSSPLRAVASPGRVRRPGAGQDCLRRDVQDRLGTDVIVGESDAIRRVLEQVEQVAVTNSTVLLLGETGTGKELLATRVHELSSRRTRAMVRVNCAAIPGTLIESELFGREKGAFTGAITRQIGRFEAADQSTIFLDEIGDLTPDVQVKLLRVLEERQIERLGSPSSLPVDVRIIAATHRDLERRVAEEAFREDLFYRLHVFPIRVPALRERPDDIPLLVWRFVIEFSRAFGKRIDSIPAENMTALQRYEWPGNIRELRNVVERAMIVATGPELVIPLPTAAPSMELVHVRLDDLEREHIRRVLDRVRWRVRGLGGAAEQLGLRPTTLETRMLKLGLARPKTA